MRSMISTIGKLWKEGTSRSFTDASERWLWGVARMPCSVPSQASTASRSKGLPAEKSASNCSWISWRASAAEHGQVLE